MFDIEVRHADVEGAAAGGKLKLFAKDGVDVTLEPLVISWTLVAVCDWVVLPPAVIVVDVDDVEDDEDDDGTTRSTPGTIAAGTGGVAGSGDVGSLVGSRGARTSGSFV